MAFGAKLPYRKLLVFTGVLVVSIMVTFIGSAVRLFQTVELAAGASAGAT